MEFRLIYEGPLRGQGAKSSHKWEIRRAIDIRENEKLNERALQDLIRAAVALNLQSKKKKRSAAAKKA